MIIRKTTCGICKPTKRFKRNNTKLKGKILNALLQEELSINLIKSYEKLSKLN